MDLAKNLFICTCMVIVSASLGFSAWANLGLSVVQGCMLGISFLVVQLVGYLFVWKAIIYRALMSRIHDLALAEADNAHGVERVSNEFNGFKKTLKGFFRKEMEPLARELEVIGSLIKQLAENSAETENRISKLETHPPESTSLDKVTPKETISHSAKSPVAEPEETSVATEAERNGDEDQTDQLVSDAADKKAEKADRKHIDPNSPIMKAVRDAVDKNRVDLYLQPIVTLPQRKPKFYEAFSRIRTEDGKLIRPAQYIIPAEQSGAMPILDKMLLVRAVQVLRRLLARKSDAVIVCNISATSLADSTFFADFKKLLRTKSDLANHMVFEFDQATINSLDALEEESLRALKALGFHFAIDNVKDLSMDFRRLVELGFHYVKVSADVLLAAKTTGINDIHAEDIPRYLSRNGIQIIVDHIETEGQVVELLDFDVHLGQGFLFAGPREVKPDASVNAGRRAEDNRLAS